MYLYLIIIHADNTRHRYYRWQMRQAHQGDYDQKKIYNEKPLEVAIQFEDAGMERLHLVDLDGAKAGSVKNWKVLETIAAKTKLVIDFGGGIKTEKDVEIVLSSGAAMATVGSIAVKNEAEFVLLLKQYGAAKLC